MRRIIALAVAATLVVGCDSGGGDEPTVAASAIVTETETVTETATEVVTETVSPTEAEGEASPTPTETVAAPPASSGELVLGPSGLRAAAFGQPTAEVLATVSAAWGAPDESVTWDTPQSGFGVCPAPGSAYRFDDIWLLFTSGGSNSGEDGFDHFMAWNVTGPSPAVTTAEGIGHGSTWQEVEDAYGPRFTYREADVIYPDGWTVSFGYEGRIDANLEGPTKLSGTTWMYAGHACGE